MYALFIQTLRINSHAIYLVSPVCSIKTHHLIAKCNTLPKHSHCSRSSGRSKPFLSTHNLSLITPAGQLPRCVPPRHQRHGPYPNSPRLLLWYGCCPHNLRHDSSFASAPQASHEQRRTGSLCSQLEGNFWDYSASVEPRDKYCK